MQTTQDLINELKHSTGEVAKDFPDFFQQFSGMAGQALKDGALSGKQKELIAVALSVSNQCTWCIATHVKNAMDAGATRQEIREACLVAILMGGGPAVVYGSAALEALKQFKESE